MKQAFGNAKHGLVLAGAVLLASTAFSYSATEDEIKRSFELRPGGKLIVDVDRGSIDVQTAAGDRLEVEVVRKVPWTNRSKAQEILRDHQVEITQEGNDVRIQARFQSNPSRFWRSPWNRLQVRYLVTTPKQFNVDLRTSGGGIAVSDLDGSVNAKTSGGSLRLGNITGPVWGRTSGGGISVDGCKDSVDVETSGGSLKIGEVSGRVTGKTSGGSIQVNRAKGDVRVHTSGGSITVDDVASSIEATTSGGSVTARLSSQPEGKCLLSTSGGSIDVRLPETVAVDLDAKTSGGRVIADLPDTASASVKSTSVKAKINGGGPPLILRTSGGNVHVRKL